MDNVKTGAFIKELRRQKNMTQRELADLLHITDRAVSKWERGLCAPDISLLEPLAAILDVTIVDLISGERADRKEYKDDLDLAAKNILDYSNREVARKINTFIRKSTLSAVSLCLVAILLIPTLNGLVGGDGFAWRCIPAYLCAQKAAKAIETGNEQAIQTYIGNSEGMSSALAELHEQGIEIRKAEAKFFRTRLDDMFLWLEIDLTVSYENIKYQFTCNGTYRDGKVEFMPIVSLGSEWDYPPWIMQLSDALSTYDPG